MKKRIWGMLIGIVLVGLLGCDGKPEKRTATEGQDITDVASEDTENNSAEFDSSAWDVSIYRWGREITLDSRYDSELISLVNSLEKKNLEDAVYVYSDYIDWSVRMYSLLDHVIFFRVYSSDGYVIMDTNMNVYDDSQALNDFFMEHSEDDIDTVETAVNEGETVYYSIPCQEPFVDTEYRDVAVECVTEWLESLQDEDTETYYRNTSFEIAEEHKNNYLACGMVNGRKEFVVEVCFTAKDCGDDTFYDCFYQEGRYTEAGTFWSGNYICGRFYYDNGECCLVDMTGRDGSSIMHSDLTGIVQGNYKTFFDFARREDLQTLIDDTYQPYVGDVVSKNLTITADGKLLNLNIYVKDSEYNKAADTIYGDAAFITYLDGEMTYGTGVYYTDWETSTKYIEYPMNFKLVFDNYNGDANPDYAVKYDEDDYGAYYVLESVQTDGRVFNLSGRANEGGVYVAGCFEASTRLQKTADYDFIGWRYDEGTKEYIPTYFGNDIELPDINMYSERLFLPETLKQYGEEENEVYCFLWNNTDKDIEIPCDYTIEIYQKGVWTPVANGSLAETTTVFPRQYAEIAYDISSVTDRKQTRYRIVQEIDNYVACGEFYLDGIPIDNITVDSTYPIPEGASGGQLSISNEGVSDFTITNAALVKDSRSIDLTLFPSNYNKFAIEAGETEEFTFGCRNGITLDAGNYNLYINDECVAEIIVEQSSHFSPKLSVSADLAGEELKLSLSSSEYDTISIDDVEVSQKISGRWKNSYRLNDEYNSLELEPGKTKILEFTKTANADDNGENMLILTFRKDGRAIQLMMIVK